MLLKHVVSHHTVTYRLVQHCTILHHITLLGIMCSQISCLLKCTISNCNILYCIVCCVTLHHILSGGAAYTFSLPGVLLFSITCDIKMYDVVTHHVPPSRTASPHSESVAISQIRNVGQKPTARWSNVADGRAREREREGRRGDTYPLAQISIHQAVTAGRPSGLLRTPMRSPPAWLRLTWGANY